MANSDLKTFMEDRLAALIPGLDLGAGSPAQLQFIDPVIRKLGTDPFETDIDKFITDRLKQEFPDLYTANAGVIRDAFIKPLILMLEPFKREVFNVKTNQSLEDPSLLSDDDADALAANVFAQRDSGGKSGGVARVYYPNPTTTTFGMGIRFYTSDGLSFYPTAPMTVSAEEMSFSRDGLFFYADIPVIAEEAGADYNIDKHSIVGLDGIFGFLKVDNLRAFTGGVERVDTATFIATAKESLTEQSLVTRRGATARLKNVFRGELRAVQVIGAKDAEMQRDILVADSPGHAWAYGMVGLYQNIAIVQARVVESSVASPTPAVGDTLFVYLDKYTAGWETLTPAERFVRLQIEEVLTPPIPISDPTGKFVMGYVLRWSDPSGAFFPPIDREYQLEGGLIKKGTVHIGSLPSVGAVDLTINNQAVHVFGHSDIYVRPVLQPESTAVLTNLMDDPNLSDFRIQRSTLSTYGADGDTSKHNQVTDNYDFVADGVEAGDLLTLETGGDLGTFTIGRVGGAGNRTLFLTSSLARSSANVRYRITKKLNINPFDPRIPRVPFGDMPNNDLRTTIGSNIFEFTGSQTDLPDFGCQVGDTVRVLDNVDAGDFVIKAFLSGSKVQVDKAAGGTNSGLHYEVFTPLEAVERPLVRVKELMLLDSSQKETGFVVPYAEPLAIVPTSDFTSAQVRGYSQYRSGFVLPDLTGLVTGVSKAADTGDRRYSLGFDSTENGIYRGVVSDIGSVQAELLFPEDAFGSCSYFVSVSEDSSKLENLPPIDPRPGETLTIKSGPNKGSYLIEKVRKFKYTTGTNEAPTTSWIYFIKIYGSFPVDVLGSLYSYLDFAGHPLNKITNPPATLLGFPSFFVDIYNSIDDSLRAAITDLGGTPPDLAAIKAAVDGLCLVDYEWGLPARGVLRSYFSSPTLFQQHSAQHPNPTLFTYVNEAGEAVKFRMDPARYDKHEVIPPRLDGDSDPLDYRRDLVPGGPLPLSPIAGRADFSDSTQPTIFAAGVLEGDVLAVHDEVFFHGSAGRYGIDRMTAVMTTEGSSTVRAPACAPADLFPKDMFGNLIFIDEGDDLGGYRVSSVPDGRTLVLDRPLNKSTPVIQMHGYGAAFGFDGTHNKLETTNPSGFTAALKGKFVTIYGIDSDYQGSYEISDVPTVGQEAGKVLYLDRGTLGDFPALSGNEAFWVITDAPESSPVANASGKGTELLGVTPIRVYSDIASEHPVSAVNLSASVSQADVTGTLKGGIKQPYRIYRKNLRRVNPTEMSAKKDGAFYYFDTEVISLGARPACNILKNSYLTVDGGTYESEGYRHVVDDYTLTYSTKETGSLELPTRLLPKDSADALDNYLSLVGAPLQVTYERAEAVAQVQDFIESAEDRVTTANMLARHFLPAYVSYDATYYGGSSGSVIAKDIINHIDNLSVETPIDVSVIEDLIANRGGNVVSPTRVFINIHDWDREQWLEFSDNELGGSRTLVPYHGSPRVCFFVPGQDTSGQSNIPDGERINLKRG